LDFFLNINKFIYYLKYLDLIIFWQTITNTYKKKYGINYYDNVYYNGNLCNLYKIDYNWDKIGNA
jgi:hypothetical protein